MVEDIFQKGTSRIIIGPYENLLDFTGILTDSSGTSYRCVLPFDKKLNPDINILGIRIFDEADLSKLIGQTLTS